MIKVVKKDLLDSNANFLLTQVDCNGNGDNTIEEVFPHVYKECLKYLKHCKKNKTSILSTVQYVPVDSWALVMCDTMKNEKVESYDKEYQYIVNLFTKTDINKIDLKAMEIALKDVRDKAEAIGATVAIKCDNEICDIVKKVFKGSDVYVGICKG